MLVFGSLALGYSLRPKHKTFDLKERKKKKEKNPNNKNKNPYYYNSNPIEDYILERKIGVQPNSSLFRDFKINTLITSINLWN